MLFNAIWCTCIQQNYPYMTLQPDIHVIVLRGEGGGGGGQVFIRLSELYIARGLCSFFNEMRSMVILPLDGMPDQWRITPLPPPSSIK